MVVLGSDHALLSGSSTSVQAGNLHHTVHTVLQGDRYIVGCALSDARLNLWFEVVLQDVVYTTHKVSSNIYSKAQEYIYNADDGFIKDSGKVH